MFYSLKKLIKMAKLYGADAVKLQTHTADSMTLNSKKNILNLKWIVEKLLFMGLV